MFGLNSPFWKSLNYVLIPSSADVDIQGFLSQILGSQSFYFPIIFHRFTERKLARLENRQEELIFFVAENYSRSIKIWVKWMGGAKQTISHLAVKCFHSNWNVYCAKKYLKSVVMLKENEKYMIALTQVFQVIMNVQDCYQQCKLLKLTMFI